MKILLVKAALIGKTSHAQGDVVECDEQRGKYLIRNGLALEVKHNRTSAVPAPAPADDLEKREAVRSPKTRKAVSDV